jgi:D-alanine--poly(phosphoribitol) ligase subunit 1
MEVSAIESTANVRQSLDGFFADSAAALPDHPAIAIGTRSWSYSRMDHEVRSVEQSLRIAGLDRAQLNVGLCYGRSILSFAAVLALMRSANVYVPLNPQTPAERLAAMIEDANLRAILIDASAEAAAEIGHVLQSAHDAGIPVLYAGPGETSYAIRLPPSRQECGWRKIESLPSTSSEQLAYIIYTSGSTGTPKGVAIAHDAAARCIDRLQQLLETDSSDRFAQFSPLSFDFSIIEMFLAWKSGGTLHVPAAFELLAPLRFAQLRRISVWSSVPSIVSFMSKLGLLTENVLPDVRITLFGGEALPRELAHAWSAAAPGSRVVNLYGPTEVTICSTFHELGSEIGAQSSIVPIGVPFPGIKVMIMDDGRPVTAFDSPGELWLGGEQLAVGYWNKPAATRTAFVQYPGADGLQETWYRTGDLVSQQAGVGLIFRGRIDRQIKLRGHRVELQEVESAVRTVTGSTCVAVVPQPTRSGMCEKIVAFCDCLEPDEATVKLRCAELIPRYMVPDRVLRVESFPLNTHGKIDYRALTSHAVFTTREASSEPQTPAS